MGGGEKYIHLWSQSSLGCTEKDWKQNNELACNLFQEIVSTIGTVSKKFFLFFLTFANWCKKVKRYSKNVRFLSRVKTAKEKSCKV